MADGPKRRGRPPRGDHALSDAERAKAYRERRRARALERPDAPWGAWVMLVSLVVGSYDQRQERRVRSILRNMPLPVRAQVAQYAADFWSNEAAPAFWESYVRWQAEEPERWPMPARPAQRRGRARAARDHDGEE